MVYYLHVGAGNPVGNYVCLHITYQEMLSSQLNKSAGAFFFPAGRRTIFTFFVILAYPKACVKSFCKKQGKFVRIKMGFFAKRIFSLSWVPLLNERFRFLGSL